MNRRGFSVRRRLRATRRRQNGNFMAFTAIALVAMIGIASLVIDVGFDLGQRRFSQNGADAAALAAARLLANSVTPYPVSGPWPQGISHRFGLGIDGNALVLSTATGIAGQNQSPGIAGRITSFTVTVEYCVAVSDSSYSAAPGCPGPNSWITDSGVGAVPDGAYKVRVTVGSSFSTFLGAVVGHGTLSASAQSVAVIQGICPQTTATGNIWPFTLWDQQDFGTDPNTLYELWGSTAPSPPFAGNWQNVLDLSPAARWCDGNISTSNPDYKWLNKPGKVSPQAFPNSDGAQGGVTCYDGSSFAGQDTTWYRQGYAADPNYPGWDTSSPDLGIWAACTFGGTLRARSLDGLTPGNKMPTYVDANPAQTGNGGNNVAQGIYGPGTYTCANGTSYFFQGVTQIDPAHPSWGPYRDVVVFTYDNPEYWSKAQNSWTTHGNSPDRVELIRVLPFRIYENYSTTNSRVYGRVVSPVIPPGSNPPLCGVGPGIYGNVVSLGA